MSTHQTQEEESFYLDNNKEKPLPQSYCNLRFLFLPVKSKGVGEKNTVLLPCCLDYNCVKGNQEKGILHKKTENQLYSTNCITEVYNQVHTQILTQRIQTANKFKKELS